MNAEAIIFSDEIKNLIEESVTSGDKWKMCALAHQISDELKLSEEQRVFLVGIACAIWKNKHNRAYAKVLENL